MLRKLAVLVLPLIILISISMPTQATVEKPISRLPDSEFIEVYPSYGPTMAPISIKSPIPHLSRHHFVVSPPSEAATPKNLTNFTKGWATYYCLLGKSRCTVGHLGGMYAAIRSDLLFLRGKTVKVCRLGTTRCIYVTIIDCNCGKNANLIDLYSDAFNKLAGLWRGKIQVTLKW